MGKSGVMSLKLLSILALFIGFSFIIIEERLDSRSLETKISRLENDIKDFNAQKQTYTQQINEQLERLSSYDYSKLGKNITMNDVIFVRLQNQETKANQEEQNNQNGSFSQTVDRFITHLFKDYLSLN